MTRQLMGNKKKSRGRGINNPSGLAFSGQQRVKMTIAGGPDLLSTTVTTGVVSYALPLDPTNVQGWAERFGDTFDEYRVRAVRIFVSPVSQSTGVSKVFFDEKSSTAPAAIDSYERNHHTLINNSSAPRATGTFVYVPRDLLDQEFSATTASKAVAYFKLYTNTAQWAAPATVTVLWSITWEYDLEFRGIKAI